MDQAFICDHEWSYGKAGPSEARSLGWECLHNRACIKCSKVDNVADRAEEELARIALLRNDICSKPVDFDALAKQAEGFYLKINLKTINRLLLWSQEKQNS